ncbi:MAG: anti-sigma factor [Chloroflexi bacterium]|nr:anti-sigma factor [Chloroflexota bacterium]
MNCTTVNDLAAAYALGAVEADEERRVVEHLSTCDQQHSDVRSMIEAAALVPVSLEPVAPSAALRGRLMATIAQTPQEDAVPVATPAQAPQPRAPQPIRSAEPRRPWWQLAPLPASLAAVALAAVVGIGSWNISLNQQLGDRDAALRAVASADAIYAAHGTAGTGWVIESGEQAMFMAEDLLDLPADQLYELWLIDGDNAPVAVGTLTGAEGLALVTLERDLGSATTFAITVESERVDAPTSEPVLVATLGT